MKDGEPFFIRCSVWREFAEHVAGSLTKGSRVIAHGSLQQRTYEKSDGEKRTVMELKIEAIGPDLRFATAQVTKASNGASSATSASPAFQEPAGDVWNAPGSYDDSQTPF